MVSVTNLFGTVTSWSIGYARISGGGSTKQVLDRKLYLRNRIEHYGMNLSSGKMPWLNSLTKEHQAKYKHELRQIMEVEAEAMFIANPF